MARLGDVCEVLNGYAFKSEKYVNAGIRVIRITNVQKGYIEDQNPVFYPINSENIDKYKLLEGDLLMSLTGNVGRVACLSAEFLPAALNQRVACLRVKDFNILDKSYLFNLLNTNYFEETCIESSNGVAQKNMSTDWLKEFEIPIPSLQKQKEIAEILDKVSGLIEKRKQQLLKLDELVKSRFIEMFGDPISNSNKLKTSRLCDLAWLKSGKNVTAKDIHSFSEEYPYPCYGGNGIRGYVEKYTHEGIYCLIGRQGALCGNIQFVKGKFYPTEHAVVVSQTERDNTLWLYYCLKFLNLNRLQTGAAQPGLNIEILDNVEIPRANIELQNQFAEFVEQVEKQKANIKQSLEKLEILKKSLMQKYFG